MDDPRFGQCLADQAGEPEIGRQFVHRIGRAACQRRQFRQIAASDAQQRRRVQRAFLPGQFRLCRRAQEPKLPRAMHLRMGRDDLLGQRGARPHHAHDKDRHHRRGLQFLSLIHI